MAVSTSRHLLFLGILHHLLGCFAASAPSAGVLRQVVGRDEARADGAPFFEPFNVTYDHRAVRVGGERRMLVSAGLHYPRATPEMWPSLIAKCKEGGTDVIETYVFWNGHEPAKGQYYFEGRFDIVKFAKLVAAEGLFLFLRIGPYACAEWNFGGFPIWLRDIPGIEFRTDNEPFKAEMQTFVTKIVDIMKEEKLYSWQGGPIILQQIENEYGNIQGRYGHAGKRYMQWAAQMALGLDTGVPWVMCRQTNAPEQIVSDLKPYSILAMLFTVMGLNQILTISQQYGLRIGMDGMRTGVGHYLTGLLKTMLLLLLVFTNVVEDCKIITCVNISYEDVVFWSSKGVLPSLTIDKIRDVARVFVNGKIAGSKVGNWVSLNQPVQLVQGLNELTLLSEIVGIQNYGAFLEKDGAGFRSQIKLTGLSNGDIDLTNSLWTYQIGLKGEYSMIYSPEKQGYSEWSGMQEDDIQSPFTWYKTLFDAPDGTDPIAIGLGSMGKGQAWVNGHHIGRYWSLVAPESGCQSSCNYAGAYSDSKCCSNCGMPTQSWYHMPREWLQESGNLLVLFEETGGDLSQISLEIHYTKTICSRISENYYPPLSAWSRVASGRASVNTVAPELHLLCDDGHTISKITFASYGTPSGGCQSFSVGKCHASSTLDLVTEACIGKSNCAISVTNDVFGDPCPRVVKDLAVEAECSPPSATKEPRDEI